MHIGLMMECDFREGGTQRQAFDEALATAEAAEALGFDGIWLAERGCQVFCVTLFYIGTRSPNRITN